MKHRFGTQEEDLNIDISPLIDVVFILLIFFIVTTVFIEETGVTVDRPQATSATMLEKESILIAITSDRQVIYGKKNIGTHGVRNVVARLLAKDDKMPVIVQSDERVSTKLLTKVIDEAKLAGAKKISISTQS